MYSLSRLCASLGCSAQVTFSTLRRSSRGFLGRLHPKKSVSVLRDTLFITEGASLVDRCLQCVLLFYFPLLTPTRRWTSYVFAENF